MDLFPRKRPLYIRFAQQIEVQETPYGAVEIPRVCNLSRGRQLGIVLVEKPLRLEAHAMINAYY